MVASIWIVWAFDRVFGLELYRFGVLPRQVKGLWGILVSPFVHADLDHLMGNSAPILVLGWLLVYLLPEGGLARGGGLLGDGRAMGLGQRRATTSTSGPAASFTAWRPFCSSAACSAGAWR